MYRTIRFLGRSWQFFKVSKEKQEKELAKDKNKLLTYSSRRNLLSAFAGMVSMLAILDLAGRIGG